MNIKASEAFRIANNAFGRYEVVSKSFRTESNEINNNNKHSLRSNTKSYGGKTH